MREYGLLLQNKCELNTEYVEAYLCTREPGKDHPLGCHSDGESAFDRDVPKHMHHLMLDGLGLYGFVTESEARFLIHEVGYRNVYSIELAKLARMTRTLKRVHARMRKDNASEPGDQFTALAASLKLTFAVECSTPPRNNQHKWRWMSLTEGRNRYRELIEKARTTTIERKGIKIAS